MAGLLTIPRGDTPALTVGCVLSSFEWQLNLAALFPKKPLLYLTGGLKNGG